MYKVRYRLHVRPLPFLYPPNYRIEEDERKNMTAIMVT
jgi:hypothetical protein